MEDEKCYKKKMKVHVHCKEKTISVECGQEAMQRIGWLAHVGIARYDTNFGIEVCIGKLKYCSYIQLTGLYSWVFPWVFKIQRENYWIKMQVFNP